jgi:DNA polymerase-3 subunit delta
MEPRPARDTGESLETILRNIARGQISPCYLIFGDEDFLVREAADRIAAAILPSLDHDFNFFVMDGDNENLDHLCTSLLTPPLIGGRKCVCVRNTRLFHSRITLPDLIGQIRMNQDRDPARAARDFNVFLDITGWRMDDLINGGWEKITDDQWLETVGEMESAESRNAWLSKIIAFCVANELKIAPKKDQTDQLDDLIARGIPEGNHLILTTNAVDKRKRTFKIIAEKGQVLEFAPTKNEAKQRTLVVEAARERLSASGKKMTSGAWQAMGIKTGFGLRTSMEALDKLITYTADRAVIQDTDVHEVIGKIKEDSLFDLTGAFVKKDLGAALMILDELLDRGMNHAQIIAMIAREIRLLLHGKIYIASGLFHSFDRKMDYNRFQRSVHPAIKAMAAEKGKGGKHLASMHPYVLYNTLRAADQFTTDKLIGHLKELVAMDMALKTTANNPKLLLERFMVHFCS